LVDSSVKKFVEPVEEGRGQKGRAARIFTKDEDRGKREKIWENFCSTEAKSFGILIVPDGEGRRSRSL